MPLGYHIGTDEGLVTVQGNGEVDLAELVELGRTLLADGDFDPTLPQLLDFRGLRPVATGDHTNLQAFVHGPYRDGVMAKIAVVIDEHLEVRHAADIFLLTCAVHDAELFSSYDQAVKWLMRQAFALAPQLLTQQEYARRDDAHGAPE